MSLVYASFRDASPVIAATRNRLEKNLGAGIAAKPLTDMALAFPESANGRRYRLEDAFSRKTAGFVEAAADVTGDAVFHYAVLALSNELCYELVAWRESRDRLQIFRQGESLFELANVEPGKAANHLHKMLMRGPRKVAEIKPPVPGKRTAAFSLPGGGACDLPLARSDSLSGFLTAIRRLVLAEFARKPSPSNLDRVITGEARSLMGGEAGLLDGFGLSHIAYRILFAPLDFG